MTSQLPIRKQKLHPVREVNLSGDTWLHQDEHLCVSYWHLPRTESDQVAHTLTLTIFDEAIQIHSKHNAAGERLYWYCDLLEVKRDEGGWHLTDLLLDVVVFPDGSTRMLDLGELAEALEEGGIHPQQAAQALRLAETIQDWANQNAFPPPVVSNWLQAHPDALNFSQYHSPEVST
ncbi:hypothetical protein COW36_21330 [bacterium (Candidatus Blackallbacteria) CG17_big_fil_post_rev_8_21_14_2_50_48_46]|uniref:DUF402 domain-containing protein n=1 Tax=bacterium (Candidatus Blackallbacteria) CG17_big_fil_post_rev_8_21_14_2_50_48_46 TaxID=2014261 RepID=A0A2M7FYY8_9BACT|nr:MAG: hypothetical protein COW64_14640 [bacterium (Candidatus Blackallbacteria) CG18_big_fil_WC_8_21_14_2_50_49_26]PIW14583.1 MAG: hypothetical protein COW36_21330 [bacterium (Candidatus Blackallbacteria) CG17_big_fil_post_rev_8_21_14_2_50_48_46]PIW47268.1 MAG: hypothetical protein COW20_13775 [bacterium (Candidatus Blackallbacteria) CG13_big_fil_rev_8_21_14_2_50_49_14]